MTRQERKVVTVLFCDLVGFTSKAEEMDPEDVAALLGPYHARLKEELERYGGTVEKFIGDAVMALFGAPVAHEDDPERAVRAALAIREYAEAEGIELRIGITTGEALVTLGARADQGETLATGDVVNTAARLQSAAPVNGILVGQKTYEATKSTIDYRDSAPVEGKGKARPIAVFEAVSAEAAGPVGLDTPLVGRESDLHLLSDALARVERERSCQLVTLVGVPGIGKSRLVRELQGQSGDVVWRHGRCLSYGDGVTLWALGEIVKAELGILESDPDELAEQKVREAVVEEWMQTQIRPLIGLSVDGVAEGQRRDEAFVAWRRFLEGIAERQTLALVFEDVHWADDDMLDFVDHLVDWASGVPLLVICTARPELLERRPAWGGGKPNALTASLSALSDEETSRLIGGLIERAVLPDETQAELLERAGGNPLYAEQFARMLGERATGELSLPETVQGIIAARLDLLEPAQKALLQDASVMGNGFWLGAVASISGVERRDVEASLHSLERKGFVRRRQEASIVGDTEYGFLHVLARDVAYGQIPRAPRAEKHRLVAEWIESLGRLEDQAEMLAYHYGEAIDLGRAAGVETEHMEEPARSALRDAGDRALALNAYPRAKDFYERALALWPDDNPERPRLLLQRAKARFLSGEGLRTDLFEEAKQALLEGGDEEGAAEAATFEAMALGTAGLFSDALDRVSSAASLLADAPASAMKAYVVANRARYLVVTLRHEEAMRVARSALAMAEELGLGEVRASALNTLGIARMRFDDIRGIDDLEESLRVALEHSSPFELVRIRTNLGVLSTPAGRLERGYEVFSARLELDARFGMYPLSAQAAMAVWDYWTGRWEDALRRMDVVSASPSGWPTQALSARAAIRLARDDLEGALDDAARALQGLEPAWDLEPGPEVACLCATVLLTAGRREEAVDIVNRVFLQGWRPPWGAGGVVELALLLVELDLAPDPVLEVARTSPAWPWVRAAAAVCRGELESAVQQLAELGSPPVEARVRLGAAERLVADGNRAEADVHVREALAFYGSVGATRYIREGEALLSVTA